jgi:hypothetical protein
MSVAYERVRAVCVGAFSVRVCVCPSLCSCVCVFRYGMSRAVCSRIEHCMRQFLPRFDCDGRSHGHLSVGDFVVGDALGAHVGAGEMLHAKTEAAHLAACNKRRRCGTMGCRDCSLLRSRSRRGRLLHRRHTGTGRYSWTRHTASVSPCQLHMCSYQSGTRGTARK